MSSFLIRRGNQLSYYNRAVRPNQHIQCTSLNFSFDRSVNKHREKRLARQDSVIARQKRSAELPTVKELLRHLYRRAHPDILRAAHPKLADINSFSIQELNGVLSTIKDNDEENPYPPRISKNIIFHMKNKDDDKTKSCELLIRTGGGDCRKQLTKSLSQFFKKTGILTDGQFKWDAEFKSFHNIK